MMTKLTNRHPVDELAGIRAQIAPLKAREAEIRAALIKGTCGTCGDQFEAVISEVETARIDAKGCLAALGDELLRPWLRTGRSYYVAVHPIKRRGGK